jgi:two-component system phosphate regulon sensor histidine kinase PhoR
VLHDVTELDQLDRLRDQFFASAAHALKTPVAVIKAQAQLLAIDPTRSAAVIERQCGRLGRLIANVVTLSRLRTGTLELHPRSIDCADVVADVGREMSTAHGQHSLVTTILGRPVVFADREALAQVVRDLIEVAYRCSVSRTDVSVTVDETDACARVRVTYEPLEVMHGIIVEAAGYEGLSVERHVVESLVNAMCGTWRSSRDASAWTDWIEIPKVNDAAH